MSILERLKGHPHVKAGTAYTILFAVGFCHLLNDMIQSVIPAMYPVLKDNFGLTFAQIGIITLVFQMTSSIFQPFIGNYADRHPQPYSLTAGMCFTLAMPYLNLFWTLVASIMTGLVISSAFSAIVVYATDLMPDKVGMVAGIFFGLMFGLGGIGSAFFGWIADMKGVEYIFRLSSWLPLLGIIAVFLPDIRAGRRV